MGFHKYGNYSFTIAVQKMSLIGGESFVADITALRRHAQSGAATTLDVPIVAEQYGETAQDAELRSITAVCRWLDRHATGLSTHSHIDPRDDNSTAVNSA